jgi:osmotically-inducible protein OsmY
VKYLVHTLALTALLAGAPLFATAAPAAAQAAQTDLAAKVKSAIDANPEFQGANVTVTAAGADVTLTGEVDTVLLRAKIGEAAKNTEGVSKVSNKIKLKKN